MELLEKMRRLIQGTQHLSKVFDQRWFDEVKEIIYDARDKPGLVMPTHTAFIGFFHDAFWDNGGKNLLAELEEAFHTISTTAKKTLREKLGRVSRGADDYISTVFELLVVNRFASRGLMVEYEPVVPSGRPEAIILIDGKPAVIEARATMDSSFPRPDGFYDPRDLGAKLAGKIAEKYKGQLRDTGLPTILFVGLNVNLRFEELEIGETLKIIAADPRSEVLSAIVFVDDYRARDFRVWWPNGNARYPLSLTAQEQLLALTS